jgi:hypothetical protein
MAQSWPATVSTNILMDGYSEQLAQNTIRSQMAVGPPKVRRRGTAAPRQMIFRQNLSSTQAADWVTFHDSTTKYGSLSFTMTHPRSTASIEVRFLSPPVLTPSSPGRWLVDNAVEVLP